MKAIIPTGGRGTRMQPLTFSSNKHFIPVANKPLIFYPIETVVEAGIKDILITYNPESLEQAKKFLGDGNQWGITLTYVLQESPKGLANIFQVCEKDLRGDNFLLHLGDNIFTDGIADLIKYFEKEKPDALVPMVHHKENTRLGVPYFDDDGRLIKYVEKPSNPPHDFAIPGLYFFSNKVFECFRGMDAIKPSERGELEISAPFQWMIDHNFRVDVLEYKGVWLDPGKFDDWLIANQYILKNKLKEKRESQIDSASKITGTASIGLNCEILNSQIEGPVIIGDNVKIIDSKIGQYMAISDDCEIINSDIENSVLMSGVKITDIKKHPIDQSLIGTGTEVIGTDSSTRKTSLFVGEKCEIKI